MDPDVSKFKYAQEVSIIHNGASAYSTGAGWELGQMNYPLFEVVFTHPTTKRKVGFRFNVESWDFLPPSLSLFDPESKAELPWEQWPKNVWSVGHPHPVTGKPFLCLPGIREYHTHSSHLNDSWENLRSRESYSLRYIIHRVQSRFGDSNG